MSIRRRGCSIPHGANDLGVDRYGARVDKGRSFAIGNTRFHELDDLVSGVCFVGVHAVAGGGAYDIQTGQVQSGNPRRFLPLAELFEDAVFGVGGITRSPRCGRRRDEVDREDSGFPPRIVTNRPNDMLDSKLQHSSSLSTVTGASSADMIQPNAMGVFGAVRCDGRYRDAVRFA